MNQMKRPWRTWVLLVALALIAVFALGAIDGDGDGDGDPARTATEQRVSTAPDAPAQARAEQRRQQRRQAAARQRRQAAAERRARQAAAAPAQPQRNCDSNYEGACLDAGSADHDCQGGSGDGPDYTGPVRSVGSDPFDLDRDGDGAACE
jgi:hypothetical protein